MIKQRQVYNISISDSKFKKLEVHKYVPSCPYCSDGRVQSLARSLRHHKVFMSSGTCVIDSLMCHVKNVSVNISSSIDLYTAHGHNSRANSG